MKLIFYKMDAVSNANLPKTLTGPYTIFICYDSETGVPRSDANSIPGLTTVTDCSVWGQVFHTSRRQLLHTMLFYSDQ